MMNWKDLEVNCHLIEVLSWRLPGGCKKNKKNLRSVTDTLPEI
jgi:hypothetical protein